MIHHKKTPLVSGLLSPRPLCPVCGTPTYSRQGVHPQCASRKADAERMQRRKTGQPVADGEAAQGPLPKPDPLAVRPWHKRCPECQAQSHISRKTCDCGHQFGEKPD